MVRTQVQLTEDEVNKLKRVASAEHRSMAELIRQAVDSFIASKVGIDIKERQRRAIAVTGRFHSEVSNLSEAHDEYLAEDLGR